MVSIGFNFNVYRQSLFSTLITLYIFYKLVVVGCV